MDVSGQLQAPSTSRKERQIHNDNEATYASEPAWRICAVQEPNHEPSVVQGVSYIPMNTPTRLFWLLQLGNTQLSFVTHITLQ
jgi:hypothetical protein